MNKLADLIIDSKIFISICTVCITLCSLLIFKTPFSSYPQFLILIFSSTFLIYNFPNYAEILNHQKKHQLAKFYIYTCPLTIVSIIISLSFLPVSVFYFFIHLGFLSFLYYLPVKNPAIAKYSLRNIPYLKIFLIAYVFSAATVIAPSYLNLTTNNDLIEQLFIDRFIFILAITIPFDIRDHKIDKQLSIKTIPHLTGIHGAKILTSILLLFYVINSMWYQDLFSILFSRLFAIIILFYFIFTLKESSSKFIFNGYIDGSMIIQLCVFVISHFILF